MSVKFAPLKTEMDYEKLVAWFKKTIQLSQAGDHNIVEHRLISFLEGVQCRPVSTHVLDDKIKEPQPS